MEQDKIIMIDVSLITPLLNILKIENLDDEAIRLVIKLNNYFLENPAKEFIELPKE